MRIYIQKFQSEFNLGGTIIRVQKDEDGKPFVEVDEKQAFILKDITGIVEEPLEVVDEDEEQSNDGAGEESGKPKRPKKPKGTKE